MRCRSGHINDVRLICGTTDDQPHQLSKEAQTSVGDTDIPVSDLLKADVIVGIWDEKVQRIVKAGSGFIVDKKRGFVVTAGHTLMNHETWREVKGKIVIGVIPSNSSRTDPVAVYRELVARPGLRSRQCSCGWTSRHGPQGHSRRLLGAHPRLHRGAQPHHPHERATVDDRFQRD